MSVYYAEFDNQIRFVRLKYPKIWTFPSSILWFGHFHRVSWDLVISIEYPEIWSIPSNILRFGHFHQVYWDSSFPSRILRFGHFHRVSWDLFISIEYHEIWSFLSSIMRFGHYYQVQFKIFLMKLKGLPNLFVRGKFLYSQYEIKRKNDLFLYRRIFVTSVFIRTIFDCIMRFGHFNQVSWDQIWSF